jgi:hypothetical protein
MNTENRLYLQLAGVFAVLVVAWLFVPSATLAFDIQQICAEKNSSGAEVHHAIRLAENQLAHLEQQQLMLRQQSSEKQASPLSDPRFHELEQATAELREQLRACRTQQESVSSTTIDTSKMAASTADTYTISGTVSLPNGDVAPAGGLSVSIEIRAVDNSFFEIEYPDIDAGKSSADYLINIPSNASTNFRIKYTYFDSYGNYYRDGYFATTFTTSNRDLATELPSDQNHTSINLTFIQGTTIAGTISLPAGDVAPSDGITISIAAFAVDNSFHDFDDVTIESGAFSGEYLLIIPVDSTTDCRVNYLYDGSYGTYYHYGYYAATGTKWYFGLATPLAAGENHTGINLTMIAGNSISGEVSMPGNDIAPVDGLGVFVYAQAVDGSFTEAGIFTIDAGAISVEYTIVIPAEFNANYRVRYELVHSYPEYFHLGYYSIAGTTSSYRLATPLSLSHGHTNINLTLIPSNTINGTVSLPGSNVAPDGGLSLRVMAETRDYSHYSSTSVTIDAGLQSADYSLSIPADASDNFYVNYYVFDFDGIYFWLGYYANGVTTWNFFQATELVPGQNHEGVDLTLISGNTITGTVSLPETDITPEDGIWDIGVVAYGDVGGSFYRSQLDLISIEEGQRSAAYSFTVPADITVYVGYELFELDFARVYLQRGYYSATGTTSWRRNQARLFFTNQDYTSIHLTLLRGKTITGTLSLPGNDTAPDDGIRTYIHALKFENDDLLFFVYTETSIDHGMGSVDYSLAVPDDDSENFVVRYNCWGGCEDYLREGYYASGGTTPSRDLATLLTAGQDHNGIDLTLLSNTSNASPFSWGLFLPTIINAGSSESP